MHQAVHSPYHRWTSDEINWAKNQEYSLFSAVKARKAELLQAESSMQQPLDQPASSTEAVPDDQSNEFDQASYSMKNGPENTAPNDIASAKVISSDSFITTDFVSAEVIATSNGSGHTSDKVTNGSKDISLQSANEKVICYTNFTGNDFVSAEVIAASNGRDQSTYDQSADRLSPIDISPPSPYKSYESDQFSSSYASDLFLTPPYSANQTLNGSRHISFKSEEFSSFFLVLTWSEKIKSISNISTFDRTRRLLRLHHISYLRRPPNDHTNGLINSRSSIFTNMPPHSVLSPLPSRAPERSNGLDGSGETSYRHVRWSMKMRSYNREKSGNFGGFLRGDLKAFLEGFSRLYRASYVSDLMIRFGDHTIIRSDHHFSTLIWGEGFSSIFQSCFSVDTNRV